MCLCLSIRAPFPVFRSDPVFRRIHRLLHGDGSGGLVPSAVCGPSLLLGKRHTAGPTGQLRTGMGWSEQDYSKYELNPLGQLFKYPLKIGPS